MARWFSIVVLATLLPARGAILSLTVFGDSLSDTGTISWLLDEFGQPPAAPPPYFEGRFSNGPLYVEQLGFPVEPAILGTGGTNWAVGGALTDSHVGGPLLSGLSLQGQIELFRTSTGGVADPDSLHLLWIGGNDVRNASVGGDAAMGMRIVGDGLGVVEMALLDLRSMGARRILVLNVPDIGMIPELVGDAGRSQLASSLTAQWNSGLTDLVGRIGDPQVEVFDVFGVYADLLADPAAFGFTNTTEQAILNPGDDPDQYIFWDDIHPTARVHAILADEIRMVIPEPGTGLLVLAAVLATTKRRTRA